MAFPEGWGYYKEYDQPGTADGEQTDYQVDITVEYVTGKMRSDFGDIRFTLEDLTELDYHLVSYTASTTALFVVKIPSLPTGGVTLRMCYGNSGAATTSDPDNVYEYYSSGQTDDSADFTLVDIYNANVNASLTYDAVNYYYKLKNITADDMIFAKINALDGKANLKLKADIYRYSNTANDQGGLIGRKKASNTWIIGRYEVGVNKLDITQGLSGTYTEKDADSYTLAQSTWFTVELEIVGTVANLKWYNSSGTLVHSETTSSINAGIDKGDWGLAGGYNINSERYFKNIIARKTTANPPAAGTFGSETALLLVGNAVATGLPLVMYNIPTGEATASGLPVVFANWELINIGNATASGLELEKWYAYTPSFFIENEDGIILKDLSFESLFPGKQSDIQKLTVINNLDSEMNMTLHPGESFNQMGDGLDTYLSHYLSSDGVNWTNQPLSLVIPANGELDFYTYWQPPSTAGIGWKQWLLNLSLEGVPSLEGWGYVSWFTVTGMDVAVDMPYTLDKLVEIDFVYGLMEEDFSDIRFTLEDHSFLKHAILTKTDGDKAYFIVQLSETPAISEEVTIYAYCGNPEAEDISDSTISQIWEFFRGTSINTDKWDVTAVGSMTSTVDDYLRITECENRYYLTGNQYQSRWIVPDVFNVEYELTMNNTPNTARTQAGVGLVKTDDSVIVWGGLFDNTNVSTQTNIRFWSESTWFNVASGYAGSGTQELTKYLGGFEAPIQTHIFNIEKSDENLISVYVNGSHVADTTITSDLDKLAIIVGKNGSSPGYFCEYVQFDYIRESDDMIAFIPPNVGEVDESWINIYPLPVRADVLYQPRDLPELDVERRFGARIGGTLFE